MRDDIRHYLSGWYNKSKTRQLAQNNRFNLSFVNS